MLRTSPPLPTIILDCDFPSFPKIGKTRRWTEAKAINIKDINNYIRWHKLTSMVKYFCKHDNEGFEGGQ